MFDRFVKPLACAGLVVFLTACAATGPKFSTVENTLPAVADKTGRVFFYREYSSFGAGMRPDIFACGSKVGESIPGGMFYADLPAGECEITIPSVMYPGERKISVTVGTPKVIYFKTWMGASSFGGRTNIEEVSAGEAVEAMQDLALTNEKKN
ncbi:hypothetical protein PO883_30725 [Massilia sp. DJPM01]|uniref:hypothetical protein n=1 Tax=Massilia sp. DJPM01 TaxID=3024404 RepID=UPI00259D527E|nr:hypothetical protein [Massilia sp. DJPM01]MDM5181555.1 hypothetical protein [Massilia sp. DJPM01]